MSFTKSFFDIANILQEVKDILILVQLLLGELRPRRRHAGVFDSDQQVLQLRGEFYLRAVVVVRENITLWFCPLAMPGFWVHMVLQPIPYRLFKFTHILCHKYKPPSQTTQHLC